MFSCGKTPRPFSLNSSFQSSIFFPGVSAALTNLKSLSWSPRGPNPKSATRFRFWPRSTNTARPLKSLRIPRASTGPPAVFPERLLSDRKLLAIYVLLAAARSAVFRRHLRHRQSAPSSGIGVRAASLAHQHDASRLQVNSVPHWEQTRRRGAVISNRFFMNRSQRRLSFFMSGSSDAAVYSAYSKNYRAARLE
jgi:hypothetical protein